MRRFATFAAKRNGREIRTIGFHHELIQRDLCRDLSHGCAIFESDDPSERNQVAKNENVIRLPKRTAEAMKDAAHLATVIAQDFESATPGVALVNHHIQTTLDREIELLLEQARLF